MAQLIIVEGPNRGKTFELSQKELLGRADACSIVLNDRRVSEQHAEIKLRKVGYEIRNLDQTKAILVNGEVFKQTRLQHGDWITIADTTLVFSEDSDPVDAKPIEVQTIDTDDLLRSQIQARRKAFEDADSVIDSIDRSGEADARLKTLYRLAHKLSSVLDLKRLCEKLAEETLEIFRADRSIVLLADDEAKKLRHTAAKHRPGSPREGDFDVSRTIIKEIFAQKEAILCNDAQDDARFLSGQSIVDQDVRAFICAPFVTQGKISGIIQIDSSQEKSFHENDLELLSAVAQFAAVLIENCKAYRKRQEFNQTLFHLGRATQQLSSYLDRDRILKEVVKLACMILNCSKASVVLRTEAGRLRLESVHGMTKEVWNKIRGSEIGERFCKQVIEEAKPLLVPDVRELGLEPNERYTTTSCLIVPIVSKAVDASAADVMGAFSLTDKHNGGQFTGNDQKILDILAGQTAIALKNAELYEKATVDVLTKVFVRRYFFQKLEEERRAAERNKASLALLMLDLDHFKLVNDTWGHQVGDVVLRTFCAVLKKCVRPATDTVARYGGEEFTVLLPNTDLENARKVAERIRSAVEAERFVVGDDETIQKTTSIGIAVIEPGDTRDTLLKKADAALYHAKDNGRNRCEAWTAELAEEISRRRKRPVAETAGQTGPAGEVESADERF